MSIRQDMPVRRSFRLSARKKNDRQRRRDYDRRQRRHGETHHGQFRWRAPGFTGGTAVEITENGGYVEVADGAAEFADAISRLNRKVC